MYIMREHVPVRKCCGRGAGPSLERYLGGGGEYSYFHVITDETYTDAELARVSVLTLDVTKTAYVSTVASVWQVS